MDVLVSILMAFDVILCLLLILLILLQSGKGSDIGSMLGGGGASQTLFGPAGGKNIMVRITTVVAVLFFVTTLALAKLPALSSSTGSKLIDDLAKESAASPDLPKGTAVTPEAKITGKSAKYTSCSLTSFVFKFTSLIFTLKAASKESLFFLASRPFL